MRLSLTQELNIHDDIVFLKTKVEPGMVVPTFNPSQQHEEEASKSLSWEFNAFSGLCGHQVFMYVHTWRQQY